MRCGLCGNLAIPDFMVNETTGLLDRIYWCHTCDIWVGCYRLVRIPGVDYRVEEFWT